MFRSLLRAKYKAEDYLSTSYSRSKKVSTTSEDSNETPPSPPSPARESREERERREEREERERERQEKQESEEQEREERNREERKREEQKREEQKREEQKREKQKRLGQEEETPPAPLRLDPGHALPNTISSCTLPVSRKLVDLKQPEPTFISRKSLPDNFNSTNVFTTNSEKKWSVGSRTTVIPTQSPQRPRPSELSFATSSPFKTHTVVLDQGQLLNKKNSVFKVNSAEIMNMTDNKINTDDIEDEVNVKERATIFGPRKAAESKVLRSQHHPSICPNAILSQVRTVSVSSSVPTSVSLNKTRKFSEGSHHPPSPSKIKNMAALFEQKN